MQVSRLDVLFMFKLRACPGFCNKNKIFFVSVYKSVSCVKELVQASERKNVGHGAEIPFGRPRLRTCRQELNHPSPAQRRVRWRLQSNSRGLALSRVRYRRKHHQGSFVTVIIIIVEPRWFLVSSSAGACMSFVWEQVDDLFSLQIESFFAVCSSTVAIICRLISPVVVYNNSVLVLL